MVAWVVLLFRLASSIPLIDLARSSDKTEALWDDVRTQLETRAAGKAEIDWDTARAAFERADGIPVVVATGL